MVDQDDPTYAIAVMYRGRYATGTLNLTTAQLIAALLGINREFDKHGIEAGSDIRVLVLEESPTRH